jgi:hypothetical protein
MVEAEQQLHDWVPSTEAERREILAQLERVLESPLFRNSKRYPILLRYLVEQALDGNEALLKERLLGVTVFHRPADYDTNQDTVVRLSAGEVRKRIAQYYHQPEHAGQLQIDLRPGSYVPVFRRAGTSRPPLPQDELNPQTAVEQPPADSHADAANATEPPGARNGKTGRRAPVRRGVLLRGAGSIVALAVVLAAGLWWWSANQAEHRTDRQLWSPILDEPGQVQLVMADLSASLNNPQGTQRMQASALLDLLRMGEMVNYRDSLAQTELVAFLARHNKAYRLELATNATYPELQRSAIVLIGGLDNVWTMRVTEPLRFHLVRRGVTYIYGIEDRQHPEAGGWNVDLAQQPERSSEDYAVVARIFDQTTGRPVLVAAGIGANGTAAAAQFLLDPKRVAELAPHAPRNWQRMNMEAVIRTQILDNHAGPPHLVDCYFW